MIDDFAEVLYKHTDGFFVQDAVGYYKGRSYEEKLLVAYIDADVTDDFVRIARVLQQECYAYERDGELFIAKWCLRFQRITFYAASVRGNSCCRQ